MSINRVVHTEDATFWLDQNPIIPNSSLIASMPDYSEFPNMSIEEWKIWFTNTAKLIIDKTAEDQVSIFYQSDIKYQGEWIDKSYLCMKAQEALGAKLLWHKVISRVPVGAITFGRPAYSHILCFSKKRILDAKNSTADILFSTGDKIWERGMSQDACTMIAKFIKNEIKSETIINPFCGMGSMLSVANAYELNAIGIERSLKRAKIARIVQFDVDKKIWNYDKDSRAASAL